MILRKMVLENFRQFYGKQQIDFATEAEHNVTLIHGFNGAGKTALLNAFIWCLYQDHSPDFEEADHLENEQAFLETEEGRTLLVRVALTFENKGRTLTVERSMRVSRENNLPARAPAEVRLVEMRNGEPHKVEGSNTVIQDRINRILSDKLREFFFFNGERVEWLASASAYERVEDGVRSMLDIEIYDRSIRHLDGPVLTDLTNELKKYGGTELEEAVAQRNNLIAESEAISGQISRYNENLGALENEREKFLAALRTIKEAEALASERDQIERDRNKARDDLADCSRQLAQLISNDGFLAFGQEVLDRTETLVADARQRGELPAKIKPQFVEDLLEEQLCICGRTLKPGDDEKEINLLRDWQSKTGLAAYEEAISLTSGQIEPMRKRRREFFESVTQLQTRRAQLLAADRRLGEELSNVADRIKGGEGGGDAAAIEAQIQATDEAIGAAKNEKALAEGRLATNAEEQERINRDIAKFQVNDGRGKIVQRQIEAVENVVDALKKIFAIQRDDVRTDLDGRIQKLWRDAAVKDYRASLSDDFRLRLLKRVGGNERQVTGTSTGEKQVLALSFIGSLVAKAKDNEDRAGPEPKPGMPTGGVYPLVMDSPFGSLEDDYREAVAGWIPKLARQVVILVSKTQWRREVENAVRPRVGREYVLELHSPKDGAARTIEIEGKEFSYVVESSDASERTQITEVAA